MIRKPILTLDEQINHLKSKGVLFNIINETDAKEYLKNKNNYFKLVSYRKNYQKHPDGENKGKYINLEFAYLVDLATIDMYLRYRIVQIALDIEHHIKLEIMRRVISEGEDGYRIVEDYLTSLPEDQKNIFDDELSKNRKSLYCRDIVKKYEDNLSIWVFVEIVPFGRLVSFYKFCANRFNDSVMNDCYYILLTCKEIRNASAHSNCILNDLSSNTIIHNTNSNVTKELMLIPGMNSNLRKNRMSNSRIQQIVTLLYAHKKLVCSDGLNTFEKVELEQIKNRMLKNYHYYDTNLLIQKTIDFLILLIDNWFDTK